MIEKILRIARRQKRSIVNLCEHFGDRSKVQNLPIRTIFFIFAPLWTFNFTTIRVTIACLKSV